MRGLARGRTTRSTTSWSSAASRPPDLPWAGYVDGKWTVTDVWASREADDRFHAERLVAAMQKLFGIDPTTGPQPTIIEQPVHATSGRTRRPARAGLAISAQGERSRRAACSPNNDDQPRRGVRLPFPRPGACERYAPRAPHARDGRRPRAQGETSASWQRSCLGAPVRMSARAELDDDEQSGRRPGAIAIRDCASWPGSARAIACASMMQHISTTTSRLRSRCSCSSYRQRARGRRRYFADSLFVASDAQYWWRGGCSPACRARHFRSR